MIQHQLLRVFALLVVLLAVVIFVACDSAGAGGGSSTGDTTDDTTDTEAETEDEPEDTTPPGEVTDLSISIGDELVKITYTEPTDDDFSRVQISFEGTGDLLSYDPDGTFITELTNGVSYTFLVQTVDTSGNVSEGVSISGTPEDSEVVRGFVELSAPSGATDMVFGSAAGISGDYAVVGAFSSDTGGENAGIAYVYERQSDGSWGNRTTISPDSPTADAEFGRLVAISGDTIAVSAHEEDNSVGSNAGAVYVFTRGTGNSWSQQQKLTAPGGAGFDRFGGSLDLDGDYLVAGSPKDDVDGDDEAGSLHVFYRASGGSSWDSGTTLLAPNKEAFADFGTDVAISGDIIVVGARGHGPGSISPGAVYVFERTGTNSWGYTTELEPPDGVSPERLGLSVAVHGNYAAVSSSGLSVTYIYERESSTTWSMDPRLDTVSSLAFGPYGDVSMAMSSDYLIAGQVTTSSSDTDDASLFERRDSGSVRTTEWKVSEAEIDPTYGATSQLGRSADVDGTQAIVGATGAAYILELKE